MSWSKLVLLIFIVPVIILGQNDKNDFGIRISGFVKSDFFYDTRQNVMLREGHFLLYPSPVNADADGVDLNAEPSMNFLSIQTRLTGSISAPDALGAKISGLLEADFFGNENAYFIDANGFRLRHAFVKLKWESTELLLGQYWHPMFIPCNFSDVISFNTGAPFQPFSRSAQIRLTQLIGDFSVLGAISMQRDFTCPGGSLPIRNSAVPELHFMVQYNVKDAYNEFLIGAGSGYKEIRPLLNTEIFDTLSGKLLKFVTDETVSGFAFTSYFKWVNPLLTFKFQGVCGQNLYDLTMLGGYAISKISNPDKNTVVYTPINTISGWTEVITFVKPFQIALWAGFTQLLGSDQSIHSYTNRIGGNEATLRGTSPDNTNAIESIFRISPRIVFVSDRLNLAFELEFTNSAYAKKDAGGLVLRNDYGKILQTENVSNTRALFAVILKF